MPEVRVHHGDCSEVLRRMAPGTAQLAYLDPPFFTQKAHRLVTKDRKRTFEFRDLWPSYEAYAEFLYDRLIAVYRVISQQGSIFVHCDRNATHVVRAVLDEVFGPQFFRSEIIWHYRRWSNSRRGLLPSHQTIYYYSRSEEYTFNYEWQDYSPSTNVDQILQQRSRDAFGKTAYKRDSSGRVAPSGDKKGVPLGDVWDIPYLNPKAKERTGYPTQKPLLLLERIISLASNPGDTVLDPFCGSGTTLVAAMFLGRNAIGIDNSSDAVSLTRQRLKSPTKTESQLHRKGRDTYRSADESLLAILRGLEYVPVHRNSGIDALMKIGVDGTPVPIRIQRENESVFESACKLFGAARDKGAKVMFVIATSVEVQAPLISNDLPKGVIVVDSPRTLIEKSLQELRVGV